MPDYASDKLDRFQVLGSTLCLDALRTLGYLQVYIAGAMPLAGHSMAGVAVTVRMLPQRPDLNQHVAALRENSAEYSAMEKCDESSVLVIDAMGWKHESVGGEIKFLRLKQKGSRGVVTDASIRDVANLEQYGLAVFAASQTAKAGPVSFQPVQEGLPIQCGGVLVCPGDIIVGDSAGVVVVPRSMADKVLEIATQRQEVETYILARLENEPASPGKYYPINEQVQREFEEWKGMQQ